MTIINYIVHSTTTDNEYGLVSGHYDCHLSTLGAKQASQLAKHLNKIYFDPGTVYCSPLSRAVETTKIIFSGHEALYDKHLMEINYGDLTHEPKFTVDAVRANHIEQPFKNGESYKDVEVRMRSFLETIRPQEVITIISHQAPQLALEVICNGESWGEALKNDWRLDNNGWQPFWVYRV